MFRKLSRIGGLIGQSKEKGGVKYSHQRYMNFPVIAPIKERRIGIFQSTRRIENIVLFSGHALVTFHCVDKLIDVRYKMHIPIPTGITIDNIAEFLAGLGYTE